MRPLALFAALAVLCPAQEKTAPREQYPVMTDAEVHIVQDWYRPGSGHKRGAEPPTAMLKEMRITGVLPAGFEKLLEPLPRDLERRLLPVPPGYRRGLMGAFVLLVKDGGLVVDLRNLNPPK